MPRLIAERFLAGRRPIVVAGTHGKTSTASMLAWVLDRAGREPGFLIGGAPLNFDLPFRPGRGAAFVIEGDEYDTAFFDKGPKFMHYRPDTVLLGTVEFDHADIYRDVEQVKTAFRRLVNLIPRRGLLIRYEESGLAREVSEKALCRVEGYGIGAGHWRAAGIEEAEGGTRFRILREGRPFGAVVLPAAGEHNVRNALAVIAAAAEQGLCRRKRSPTAWPLPGRAPPPGVAGRARRRAAVRRLRSPSDGDRRDAARGARALSRSQDLGRARAALLVHAPQRVPGAAARRLRCRRRGDRRRGLRAGGRAGAPAPGRGAAGRRICGRAAGRPATCPRSPPSLPASSGRRGPATWWW